MEVTWKSCADTGLPYDSPGLGTPESPALGILDALTDHTSLICIISERMKLLSKESLGEGRDKRQKEEEREERRKGRSYNPLGCYKKIPLELQFGHLPLSW